LEYRHRVWCTKQEWFGVHDCEKKSEDTTIRLDRIHEREIRTDRQTDEQTDEHRMTA